MQNFIELSAAVHQLSCVQRKKLHDGNNTVCRYRADSRHYDRRDDRLVYSLRNSPTD